MLRASRKILIFKDGLKNKIFLEELIEEAKIDLKIYSTN
jgi:hypothetical protein